MTRLPIPGSDKGDWGDILNEYLRTSLDETGQLSPNTVGSSQLQSNSIGPTALAPNSVTSAAVAPNSIGNTHLSSGVQASLGKANSALQSVSKSDIGLSNVDNTSDVNKPVSTAVQTALGAKINSSLIGANNGVAALNSTGKLAAAHVPDGLGTTYHGAVASTARPSTTAPVYWQGTVAPTNAIAHDEWYDESTDLLKRFNGTIWIASGAGTYLNQSAAVVLPIATTDVSGLATVATSGNYNDLINKPTPGSSTATTVAVTGLTGATAASRYAGATTSGAPTSGSFIVGDYIIDQTGAIWICTAAGTPGTWVKSAGTGGGSTLDTTAADIQPSGLRAAGSTGKAADAGHVHPGGATILTTSNSAWPIPAGATVLELILVGSGGGGGGGGSALTSGGNSTQSGGGGGGAGASVQRVVAVGSNTTLNITVGATAAGGTGGAVNGNAGNDGVTGNASTVIGNGFSFTAAGGAAGKGGFANSSGTAYGGNYGLPYTTAQYYGPGNGGSSTGANGSYGGPTVGYSGAGGGGGAPASSTLGGSAASATSNTQGGGYITSHTATTSGGNAGNSPDSSGSGGAGGGGGAPGGAGGNGGSGGSGFVVVKVIG